MEISKNTNTSIDAKLPYHNGRLTKQRVLNTGTKLPVNNTVRNRASTYRELIIN